MAIAKFSSILYYTILMIFLTLQTRAADNNIDLETNLPPPAILPGLHSCLAGLYSCLACFLAVGCHVFDFLPRHPPVCLSADCQCSIAACWTTNCLKSFAGMPSRWRQFSCDQIVHVARQGASHREESTYFAICLLSVQPRLLVWKQAFSSG